MKLVLLETYYRSAYIGITVCFIEFFTYFIVGIQLEYFSGLFTFSYQAIEFDFCEDIQLQIFLKENGVLPAVRPNWEFYSFFILSTNEAKAWFYLFMVYLSYFHCVELDKLVLYYLLTCTKMTYITIFVAIQCRGIGLPGLLKTRVPPLIFVGWLLPVLSILLNQHIFLLAASSFKELQLESLDSELI